MYDLHTYLQTLPLVKIFLWFLLRVLIRLSACFVKNIYWSNNTPSHNFDFSLHCFTLPIKKIIHGLWTPNEAFFHQNPKLLGLGRQFGQIHFREFGVFLTDLSAPILKLWVSCPLSILNHYFYKKPSLYIQIPNIYLGLGYEFGLQRVWDLAIVYP